MIGWFRSRRRAREKADERMVKALTDYYEELDDSQEVRAPYPFESLDEYFKDQLSRYRSKE